jgi:hypothetical protein
LPDSKGFFEVPTTSQTRNKNGTKSGPLGSGAELPPAAPAFLIYEKYPPRFQYCKGPNPSGIHGPGMSSGFVEMSDVKEGGKTVPSK